MQGLTLSIVSVLITLALSVIGSALWALATGFAPDSPWIGTVLLLAVIVLLGLLCGPAREPGPHCWCWRGAMLAAVVLPGVGGWWAYTERPLDTLTGVDHFRLASGYRKQGQLEQAAAEFRWAIKRDPKLLKAYVGLATMQMKLNRHGEAIRTLTTYLRARPDDAARLFDRGVSYMQLADRFRKQEYLDAAADDLDRVQQITHSPELKRRARENRKRVAVRLAELR